MLSFSVPSAWVMNAPGSVGVTIAPVSAVLPSMFNSLKLSGNDVSGSRRLPPSRSVAGSRGLMSLVAPTCAACASGRS